MDEVLFWCLATFPSFIQTHITTASVHWIIEKYIQKRRFYSRNGTTQYLSRNTILSPGTNPIDSSAHTVLLIKYGERLNGAYSSCWVSLPLLFKLTFCTAYVRWDASRYPKLTRVNYRYLSRNTTVASGTNIINYSDHDTLLFKHIECVSGAFSFCWVSLATFLQAHILY